MSTADEVQAKTPFRALGPDFPFDYESWLHDAEKHGALGTIPEDNRGTEVAIVGAGIAGVVAAYELARMGLKPVVFEPGQIGGRLRSIRMGEADHLVAELGGMRFPTSGRAFYHYVDLFGPIGADGALEVKPFPNPMSEAARRTVVDLEGRQISEVIHSESESARTGSMSKPQPFHDIEDAWNRALADVSQGEIWAAMDGKSKGAESARPDRNVAELKRLWNELVLEWDDKSFWNFLVESGLFTYEQREIFGHVGFGTGGWDSDFPNSMLEIFRVAFCKFDEDQHFIVGGAQQLPQRLWGRPAWEGESVADMHGGAPRRGVSRICRLLEGDDFRVTDDVGQERDFSCVLLTPQTWLYRVNLGVDDELFAPSMWPAFERTSYMSSSKAFVMVDRAFWNDDGYEEQKLPFSMTVTDRGTRATYLIDGASVGGDPHGPAIVILTYAWDDDARKVLPLDSEARVKLALDILEKIYGPDMPLREHIIGEPITVSWSTDPNFLGAFKGALPGHYRYNRQMYSHFMQCKFEPKHRGIFVAGDGISWTPAWAEGAVQTALNAVWGIMNHLGGASFCDNPGPGDLWEDLAPLALPTSDVSSTVNG